jgi:hypothetical protein
MGDEIADHDIDERAVSAGVEVDGGQKNTPLAPRVTSRDRFSGSSL